MIKKIYTKEETKNIFYKDTAVFITAVIIIFILDQFISITIPKSVVFVVSVMAGGFVIKIINEIILLFRLRNKNNDFSYYLHNWKIYSVADYVKGKNKVPDLDFGTSKKRLLIIVLATLSIPLIGYLFVLMVNLFE